MRLMLTEESDEMMWLDQKQDVKRDLRLHMNNNSEKHNDHTHTQSKCVVLHLTTASNQRESFPV